MMAGGCAGRGLSPPDAEGETPADSSAATDDVEAGPPADTAVAPDLTPAVPGPDADAARLVLDRIMQAFTGTAGCAGTSATIRVTNVGGKVSGPLQIKTADEFPAMADSCSGQRLKAGDTCTVEIEFRAMLPGQRMGTLTVSADPGGTAEAVLTGTALSGDATSLRPISADFGAVSLGQTSAAKSFELRNIGGAALQVTEARIIGGGFVVTRNGCQPNALAPGESCQVEVAFHPEIQGLQTAILTVLAPGCGAGVSSAQLAGIGVAASGGLAISSDAQDFGDFCSSKPAVFQVTNTGTLQLFPLDVQIGGQSFQITSNGCIGGLAPGQSCLVTVEMLNVSAGAVGGALVVTATGAGATAKLRGVTPGMVEPFITAPPIPSTVIGQKSPPVELVVMNTGTRAVTLTTVITNVAAAEYTIVDSDCDRPLAGGSSCRLHIVFAPTALGVRNAAVVLTETGCPGGSASVQLTGIGTMP
jgi:hypothetical protein